MHDLLQEPVNRLAEARQELVYTSKCYLYYYQGYCYVICNVIYTYIHT